MAERLRWVLVAVLAMALVTWIADLAPLFGSGPAGIAYAKGGGGGGGGGGGNGGGNGGGGQGGGAGAGAGRGNGGGPSADGVSPGSGMGNAVSEAATSTAHAGKAAAEEAGFKNLGEAVSSAVHEAQQGIRDRETTTENRTGVTATVTRRSGTRVMLRTDPTGRP